MDWALDCRFAGRSWKTIGGRIWTESQPGRGAQVSFTLPLSAEHVRSQSELSPTVFVVDDDDEMRASLATLLDVLGFAVRTFSSASSFLRFYQAGMPGCLMLDIRMPRQTGLELYEQLLREGKRLPVIFITAHADVPTAVAAMKTGALEFLEKPFDRHNCWNACRRQSSSIPNGGSATLPSRPSKNESAGSTIATAKRYD